MFDIPVVLLTFRRSSGVLQIIDVLRKVRPSRVYVLSDGGRSDAEWKEVNECRLSVEKAIDWDCTVVKRYATENGGVYGNIALGAKWVFEQEERAIFLEDDNLPEETFFRFCQEMLSRYETDNRILWVCGTNYMGKYSDETGESYYFTRQLLPCGWASWSSKFLKYYDFELANFNDVTVKRIRDIYPDKRLFNQQIRGIAEEVRRRDCAERYHSWDYHMLFSLVSNNMYGISPCNNQIKNIGIDAVSEHGFKKPDKHTMNLCGMDSFPMSFPLKHPSTVIEDRDYERALTGKILNPLNKRIKGAVVRIIKRVLKVPEHVSITGSIKKKV